MDIIDIELHEREAVTVACLRRTGPYGEGIATFWRQTVYDWLVTDGLLGRPRYGISLDNPGVTAPEKCRYDAGVEVSPDYVPANNVYKTNLPGGLYAVYRFQGPPAQIGVVWHKLMEEWLPASGYQMDGRLPFEHVPADSAYDPQTGAFSCEICIPVVRR